MKWTNELAKDYWRCLKAVVIGLWTAVFYRRPVKFINSLLNIVDMGAVWVVLESLGFMALFLFRLVCGVILALLELSSIPLAPAVAMFWVIRERRRQARVVSGLMAKIEAGGNEQQ